MVFSGYNLPMSNPISILKSNGTKELFDESKLVNSLKRVGTKPDVIEAIVGEVVGGMRDGMTTADIYNQAFDLLREQHHHKTAIRYSVRRALFDLGPDGFPFERFVARIFRLWGYETLTDQMLLGTCVEHEMDVVAWKGEELSMVEAKFHNEFGLKSDLKVVLYVKSRFDDLSETVFDFGGQPRKLSSKGRWLVTNTKFTDVAVKYGECNNINMIGWNYPNKGNLHEIIEDNGLHPVTCLSTLTRQQKQDIIGRNILTCIDVVGQPGILKEIGVRGEQAEQVLTEAQMVVEQMK